MCMGYVHKSIVRKRKANKNGKIITAHAIEGKNEEEEGYDEKKEKKYVWIKQVNQIK